jgi:hypothetical protein
MKLEDSDKPREHPSSNVNLYALSKTRAEKAPLAWFVVFTILAYH